MPPSPAAAGRSTNTVDGAEARSPDAPPNDEQPASIKAGAEASSNASALTIGHRPQPFVGGAPQRQPHAEMRARPFVANQVDRAAVGLHALGDDRQADPRAADGAALRPPALIERL